MFRVLVTGGRGYNKIHTVYEKLDMIKEQYGDITIVHGGCPTGADAMADSWAKLNGCIIEEYKAKWDDLSHPDARIKVNSWGKKYDANAGHRRNMKMAKTKPDLVVAFPGGPGTKNMIECANEVGLNILKIKE